MKNIFLALTIFFASTQSFAGMLVMCHGMHEGKSMSVYAYDLHDGGADAMVTVWANEGLEYNYGGDISLAPAPDVLMRIYGRGVRLTLMDGEDRSALIGELSTDDFYNVRLRCSL